MTVTARRMTNELGARRAALLIITLILAGRAMTVAFIADAGSGVAGDPPAAWLMPLLGDAVIGLSAFVVAYLILRGRGLSAWTMIVTWNVIGIWDALSAYVIHVSVPWPEFFMIEVFGASMFFAASAMHLINLFLVTHRELRNHYLNG
ncbi:MAG: hypothetical protein ABFR95_06030 [Actinomycetota bacterium]